MTRREPILQKSAVSYTEPLLSVVDFYFECLGSRQVEVQSWSTNSRLRVSYRSSQEVESSSHFCLDTRATFDLYGAFSTAQHPSRRLCPAMSLQDASDKDAEAVCCRHNRRGLHHLYFVLLLLSNTITLLFASQWHNYHVDPGVLSGFNHSKGMLCASCVRS